MAAGVKVSPIHSPSQRRSATFLVAWWWWDTSNRTRTTVCVRYLAAAAAVPQANESWPKFVARRRASVAASVRGVNHESLRWPREEIIRKTAALKVTTETLAAEHFASDGGHRERQTHGGQHLAPRGSLRPQWQQRWIACRPKVSLPPDRSFPQHRDR